MPAWIAIALKDLRVLSRDRMALFWVLGFPIVFAAFFGSVMRAGLEDEQAPMRVIVVERDDGARDEALAIGLTSAGLEVQRAPRAQAREAVRSGEAIAFVDPSPEASGAVELGIDPVRRAEATMLEGLVLRSLAAEFVPLNVRPPSIEARSVVASAAGPHSGFELVFPAMILWGLLGCAATFAVAIVSERASGTLLRLRAAPLSNASILGGKAGACVLACLADALLLGLLGVFVLDVRVGDPGKLVAAIAATALCFSGLTMVLGVLGKSEQAVAGAGWSTLIVLAMLGGAMVPLPLMPEWLLSVSDVSPVKWGIRALEGATWRADDWGQLLAPLGWLVALGVAGFALGAAVLQRRQEV
jgi:ABC-2 type transport system permease protein